MCCLRLQEREIIKRRHHISTYRVHVELPYLSSLYYALIYQGE
jgi:hypothetical protein